MMHPFVSLMRRYVVDYTNSHDQSVCDEIMRHDYRVHISGTSLDRDGGYRAAVASLFEDFVGLELEVHELMTNGDMLAMRFTEHGASLRKGGHMAAWRGIGVYAWDGHQLVRNHVEQDFFARRQQLGSGDPAPIEPPHHDPWLKTQAEPPSLDNEAVVRSWLGSAAPLDLPTVAVNGVTGGAATRSPITAAQSTVTAMFSAGGRVALHAVLQGPYAGGLLEDEDGLLGRPAFLALTAILHVEDGAIVAGHVITDREGLRATLRSRR